MHGKYMVSFDVESLFTNIPLEKSIELAVNTILEGIPNIKLTHQEFKKLFLINSQE